MNIESVEHRVQVRQRNRTVGIILVAVMLGLYALAITGVLALN